jgi:hypothetical protein
MLPVGMDSVPELEVEIPKEKYKSACVETPNISEKQPDIIKQMLAEDCPLELYQIGRRMRYADGYANRQLIEKAKLVCRKENLDWFIAMSILKEISTGGVICRYPS